MEESLEEETTVVCIRKNCNVLNTVVMAMEWIIKESEESGNSPPHDTYFECPFKEEDRNRVIGILSSYMGCKLVKTREGGNYYEKEVKRALWGWDWRGKMVCCEPRKTVRICFVEPGSLYASDHDGSPYVLVEYAEVEEKCDY